MKREDVQAKIDVIVDSLDNLGILKGKSYEDFVSDFRNVDSALHRLQTSIQALLDIRCFFRLENTQHECGNCRRIGRSGISAKGETGNLCQNDPVQKQGLSIFTIGLIQGPFMRS